MKAVHERMLLWNRQLKTLARHFDKVHSVILGPDGTLLANGSNVLEIKLWQV